MELKIFIFILSVFSFYAESSEIVPFVINGTDATIEEFPFMVKLFYYFFLNKFRFL